MPRHKNPNTLTVERLREEGWIADVVERQLGPRKADYMGIADVVAFRAWGPNIAEVEVLLVQATSPSNRAARVKKLRESPSLALVAAQGAVVEVWSWKGSELHSRVKVDPSPKTPEKSDG